MNYLKSLFGIKYDVRLSFTESLIVYVGVLYLLNVVDSYFVWDYKNILTCVICLLVLLTIPLNEKSKLRLSKEDISFFSVYSIYAVITIIQVAPDSVNIFYFFVKLCFFLPLFYLILWPPKMLYGLYRAFYKIIILFSIGSIIITLLGFFSLLDNVPYIELDAHEALHENSGTYYRVYCGILTDYGGLVDHFVVRACGFLCEPGHWAITLSIIYAVERLLKHTPNFVVVICGLLTFSTVFISVVIISELCIITKRKHLKNILFFPIALMSIILVYFFLPSTIKDPIDEVLWERGTNDFIDMLYDSSITDALDTRANDFGRDYYLRYIRSGNILWGDGSISKDRDFILSDYRLVLIQQGVVGIILVFLTILASVKGLLLRDKIPLFAILLIILLHRAWMFQSPYFCLMVFIGRNQIRTTYKNVKFIRKAIV